MTDRRRALAGDTLGRRLALTFLGFALAAIVILAGFMVVFASADVSRLLSTERTNLTNVFAVAAGAAWNRHNSWAGANLQPTLGVVSDTGATAQVRSLSGALVAASPGFARAAGQPEFSAPVVVSGVRRGSVVIRYSGMVIGDADHALQLALLRAIGVTAGLEALLAFIAGIAISHRLTRPVDHIIAVTRARKAGDPGARIGPMRGPAELREFAASFDDMAETLGRQDQLRRDLVADVAHELRTPIAVLQAGHEALLDGIAEPTAEQLGSLRDEVLRLAAMVGDLQTLAAADAAALHLSGRECDLADIAAAAADSLAGRFGAADIELDRDLAPVLILADQRWLHQVVTNLLTNALKYSAAGQTVTITTGVAGPDAELVVTDHGMGIAPEDMPRIFDRFWRGQQAAAHSSGSGIGLAVAAELARAHGGSLTATSRVGEGTQMTLALPRAR